MATNTQSSSSSSEAAAAARVSSAEAAAGGGGAGGGWEQARDATLSQFSLTDLLDLAAARAEISQLQERLSNEFLAKSELRVQVSGGDNL